MMNESMSSERFTDLVEHVAEVARDGKLLTEELHQRVLESLPEQEGEGSLKAIARAVRQLGPTCDWREFQWANEFLQAGGCPDEAHLEIQRINDERESLFKGPEFNQAASGIAQGLIEIHQDQRRFIQVMRDAETLMGFDQEVTNQLIAPLGGWDDSAVPASLLELLPEDLVFPLRKSRRASPYDHRFHLLVRELVSRLGDEGVSEDEVVQECGHVLAELIHFDDEGAASKLVQKQVTLRAEAYVKTNPWDTLALCWRGELACWACDQDLIEECARRVWERVRRSSAKEINKVTAFFALTTDSAVAWSNWGWDRLDFPRSHLGEVETASIDVERPLAHAVVRNAMQRGVWDTSLLCSTFELRESGYTLDADDLPVECWVWMAENIEHSRFGTEMYYEYWNQAFRSLGSDTDPRLAHNISVVLLAALLFDKCHRYEVPSISEVLKGLTDTFRADSTAHKRQAALEMVRYVYQTINPDHLTAADRLAITSSLEYSKTQNEVISPAVPPSTPPPQVLTEQDYPSLLAGVEADLKQKITEAIWARLSPVSKDEFRHGELAYITATKVEGEGGNFKPFVMHFSMGLLEHIQESLKGPLVREPSLRPDFHNSLGLSGHPEWSELLVFMTNLEKVGGTTFGKRLLSQGVALPHLRELRDFFEKMKACRNKAAHTKHRIDREEAAILHDLLLNKGHIQKVVQVFPTPFPHISR
jgi:hypothetical protein